MTQGERRTRGFLFADLRGYTAFVEGHGDDAAAELLAIYRELVREVIATSGGAEIKTEGDSFYVVFGSASDAVEAGLRLIEAAGAASTRDPEHPVRVGVGIHAGDTVEVDDTYVGSAVNLAARVCSVARAGEVTVTETVRGLVRTALPVHFVDRGTPKLKGISQPVAVFAVRRGPAPVVPRWRRGAPASSARPVGLVLAAVAVALLASLGGIVLFAQSPKSPAASDGPAARLGTSIAGSLPSASASLPAAATQVGPMAVSAAEIAAAENEQYALSPGDYLLTDVRPSIGLSIAEPGWVIDRQYPDGFNLLRRTGDAPSGLFGYVSGGVVQVVLDGPCPDSKTEVLGTDPAALIAWLQKNEWLKISDPLPVNVGGRTGLRVDISQAKSPKGVCKFPAGLGSSAKERLANAVYLFLFGEDNFWVGKDEHVRVMVLDVDGRPFTILEGTAAAADFAGFTETTQPLVDSLRFGPG